MKFLDRHPGLYKSVGEKAVSSSTWQHNVHRVLKHNVAERFLNRVSNFKLNMKTTKGEVVSANRLLTQPCGLHS